eukprot:scaffold3356_cov112-Isochrysis_galbana.AAC.5
MRGEEERDAAHAHVAPAVAITVDGVDLRNQTREDSADGDRRRAPTRAHKGGGNTHPLHVHHHLAPAGLLEREVRKGMRRVAHQLVGDETCGGWGEGWKCGGTGGGHRMVGGRGVLQHRGARGKGGGQHTRG